MNDAFVRHPGDCNWPIDSCICEENELRAEINRLSQSVRVLEKGLEERERRIEELEKERDDELDMTPVYATLHFYYDDPDSMRRYKRCNDAETVCIALSEYDNWLRNRIKYDNREELQPARDALYRIFDEFAVGWDD